MGSLTNEGFRMLSRDLLMPIISICTAVSAYVYASNILGGTATLSLLCISTVVPLGIVYLVFWRTVLDYINKSIADDLTDIDKYYMSESRSHFFVAVDSDTGDILGCVALDYKPKHDKFAGWGELRRMSVAKAGQRRGIASLLHNALLVYAKSQKLNGIFLTTSTIQHAALALYKKLGYNEVATASFYPYPLESIKYVTFALELSKSS
jgi:GNAT superfamily N-acetyltransferase